MPDHDADDCLPCHGSLRTALELIDQGMLISAADGRLRACNAQLRALLELPDALTRPGASLDALVHHEATLGAPGPSDGGHLLASRLSTARAGTDCAQEWTRRDGRVLQWRGRRLPAEAATGGEPGDYLVLVTDVTDQRRAERQLREQAADVERQVAERTSELRLSESQLRLITDSIPALIGYFDHRRDYRYVNRGYVEWFGLDPKRPQAISARSYLGDAVYESIRPNVSRALAGHAVSYEYDAHCVDGRSRTAHTTLIPEIAADGSVLGCFELTFDVSELRRAQDRLAQAEKMEALGQLTGGIAHDFNNMLTVILGNLGALRDGPLGEPAAEFLDPSLAAGRRGAELIRSLLGFARRQPLQAQAADVGALADTVALLLRRSLPQALAVEIEAPAQARAWVDPSRLQDALVNLVLNARDAGAHQVQIRSTVATLEPTRAAELQAAPGRFLRLDVKDDGHGMDATTRARVFEPFFTTKRPGTGTGLGAAMVYGFVRQSGGAIELDSSPGHGTTVSMWLPIAPEPAVAPEAQAATRRERIAQQALALLVEDDPEVRKVVRRSLVDLGFAVIEAGSGAEALQILDHTPRVELLLSDVVMPGEVDGRAVARHARALRVPRVALMSGYVPDERGEAAGDVPLLPKPFTQRQLADFLQRQVRA